jgi:phospholipid/cholesterol/gamma-HCH transport system ATP-binding protein
MITPAAAVAFERVTLAFDETVVLRDLSFAVPEAHTLVILGGSGTGKSLILKLILGLVRPDAGAIQVEGRRIDTLPEAELMRVRTRIGMLFQESALFDSLTVAENVGYGLVEHAQMTLPEIDARVAEVLGLIGMGDYLDRLPSELSGGQRRRVAVARAMAARPPLLLFDEPTSGLDPITATTVDDEIIKSRDVGQATSIVVTHQVRDALYIATHSATIDGTTPRIIPAADATTVTFLMLRDGTVYFHGSADDLIASPDPYLREFVGTGAQSWVGADPAPEDDRSPGRPASGDAGEPR